MRWKLIPVFKDGKGRDRLFAYELAMFDSDQQTDTEMYKQLTEVNVWCHQQFTYGEWRQGGWDYSFVHHADAMAFKIRWG